MTTLSNTTKGYLSFLTVLVVSSLLLNMFLIWQWFALQQEMTKIAVDAQLTLAQAVTDLDEIKNLEFSISVPVDKEIPVSLSVDVNETVKVSVDQNVKVKENVKIPPIVLNDVKVPLADVPLDMDIPVKFDQNVPVNFTVPVKTTVPVKMDIPVEISLKEAGLEPYIDRLQQILVSINESISQLPQ